MRHFATTQFSYFIESKQDSKIKPRNSKNSAVKLWNLAALSGSTHIR